MSTLVPQQRIFVSYSHSDTKWLDRLRPYLDDLVRARKGTVQYWVDIMIDSGSDWRRTLKEAMDSATAAIFAGQPRVFGLQLHRRN